MKSDAGIVDFMGLGKYEGPKMPSLFVGHGSPMNAIENNSFTRKLEELGSSLPKPRAILCISAHWMTEGTWVTHMDKPQTIHDFYGFPQELFDVNYPAPGAPGLAEAVQGLVKRPVILDESSWGLDHGTWAVLRRIFPAADIPVVQLSLDIQAGGQVHLEIAQALQALREQGVLILGSGNIVHNLRRVDWNKKDAGFDWAIEFDEQVKSHLISRDLDFLNGGFAKTEAGRLSVPTVDHYLPLLYVVGASSASDMLKFEYEGYDLGAISMRCLSYS
jgi:4,5-DOPA dioxygenase extradiol